MTTMLRMALAAALPLAPLAAQTPTVVEQASGTTVNLIAVSAVDSKVVWASGGRGMVLRTLDGGATWESHPVPEAVTDRLEFRDIHALSANLAWVLSIDNGTKSRIYRTTDGGESWTPQFINTDTTAFYDCLTMFDATHGIAFSDTPSDGLLRIIRTEDGVNWKQVPTSGLPAALKGEGGFASSGGCAVSWGDRHGWIGAGTPESRVFRTTDAGKSWSVSPTPLLRGGEGNQVGGLTAVAFRSATHGIAVGSRISLPLDTTANTVATTSDGGKTWTLRRRPPPGAIYGVVWAPGVGPTTAIASTLGGLMLTRDEGDSWTALTGASRYWAVATAGKFAWGVGPGGRITRIEF